MNNDIVTVWCAPGLSVEQVEELRTALQNRREDPDFNPMLNFQVSIVTVRAGDIVIVEDVSKDDLDLVRIELDKAWGDPTHIAVVPFTIDTLEYPR